MKYSALRSVSAALFTLSAAITSPVLAAPDHAQAKKPAPGDFLVIDGRVDRGTYAGWRVFHTTCYSCHGVDAKGTSIAPNLVERIKNLTPRAFATKVFTSYRIALPTGDMSAQEPSEAIDAQVELAMRRERLAKGQLVMPAWEGSGPVNAHVLDLYAYLSARADGSLGPGKPKLMGSGHAKRK